MRNTALSNSNFTHILTSLLDSFANGLGYLVGLSKAMPNLTIAVTNNANRTKTEATPTFYNFSGTIDEDNFFNKLIFRIFILKV